MVPFPSSTIDPARAPGTLAPLVLVVSSDPVIAELLFWMLSLAGYQVWLMATEEALFDSGWKERHSPALVLLDVSGQPEVGQWHWLEQVRRCWSVPWLVLTDEPTSFLRSREGLTVLGKPFHLHDLLWQVAQLLALVPLASRFIPKTALFHLGTVPRFITYEEEHDARSFRQ